MSAVGDRVEVKRGSFKGKRGMIIDVGGSRANALDIRVRLTLDPTARVKRRRVAEFWFSPSTLRSVK